MRRVLTRAGGRRAAAGEPPAPWGAPEAVRQQRARLSDLRLWLAVGLLAACAGAGALLMGQDEGTVTVWRATRDLAVGAPALDLEPVLVPPGVAAAGYLGPPDDLTGRLRWPVRAGELLPSGVLAAGGESDLRHVTVPVHPLHAPTNLRPGMAVDAWASPAVDALSAAASPAMPPALVLADVLVADVSWDQSGLTGELGVVLEVPATDVPALVAAARGGTLDLVAVPADGQEPVS